ncbi:MAG TPA: 2-phospho-L-lactate guanylyltransferase [Actinomycetes bacterium]|nr:2-phospho-L-lactate guanylyltransferase [Actinomycetes bacterium]
MSAHWCLVVPVKRLDTAKTRLTGLAADHRAELALAFAADTVAAALDCRWVAEVLVVTSDPAAAPALAELGANVVPDEPEAGLNPALRHGATVAADRWPRHGVGALSADLPSLRSAELDGALDAAGAHARAFLADAAGTGTTLLTARSGIPLQPQFGRRSGAAHLQSGAVALVSELGQDAVRSVRRDVDTPQQLYAALRAGVGGHTAAVLASLARMQATVRTFDPATRSGSVLLDDGTELPFDQPAFEAGGLRLLRFGQRVRIMIDGEGPATRVTFVTLSTL